MAQGQEQLMWLEIRKNVTICMCPWKDFRQLECRVFFLSDLKSSFSYLIDLIRSRTLRILDEMFLCWIELWSKDHHVPFLLSEYAYNSWLILFILGHKWKLAFFFWWDFCFFLHPDFSQNQVKEIFFSLVRSPGYVDMQFPGIVLTSMCANEETGQGHR